LSFGLPCLASAIPANLGVGLDSTAYFELGDTGQLARKLTEVSNASWTDGDREQVRSWVGERYDWAKIAAQTAEVYRKSIG